jgi:hypothetical protein
MALYDSLYTIVNEKSFDKQYFEDISKLSQLEEWKLSLDWLLSRNPYYEDTQEIKGFFRILKTPESWGFPPIRVLYRVNDQEQKVYLIAMQVIDGGNL